MCTSRHGYATVVLECHDPCEDTKYGKAEVVTLKHSYPVSILDILQVTIATYISISKCCNFHIQLLFRKAMDDNEHGTLSNFTLRHKVK